MRKQQKHYYHKTDKPPGISQLSEKSVITYYYGKQMVTTTSEKGQWTVQININTSTV